jgi:hypothetical protein
MGTDRVKVVAPGFCENARNGSISRVLDFLTSVV